MEYHIHNWYYFSTFYRACRKCGMCQEGEMVDGDGYYDTERISWHELPYDDFIFKNTV